MNKEEKILETNDDGPILYVPDFIKHPKLSDSIDEKKKWYTIQGQILQMIEEHQFEDDEAALFAYNTAAKVGTRKIKNISVYPYDITEDREYEKEVGNLFRGPERIYDSNQLKGLQILKQLSDSYDREYSNGRSK